MSIFIDRLEKERERLGLKWVDFANYLEIPISAMEEWRYRRKVPRKLKTLDKLSEKIPGILDGKPEIFEEAGGDSKGVVNLPLPPQSDSPKREINPTTLVIKKEMAVDYICATIRLLNWFLFEANAEERNQLRSEVGDEKWEWFMNLTRAMASETAFAIIVSEGHFERRPTL